DVQDLFVSRRIARLLFKKLRNKNDGRLLGYVNKELTNMSKVIPGSRDTDSIRDIKSWLREFEAELAWAHFGIKPSAVHHLRLKFYTADIFPKYPDHKQDVLPIVKLLEKEKPSIITLAMDPEGSGPDTHFKTLIAISLAVKEYVKNGGNPDIKIWGYRNVWSRYYPADVSMIVPVSLSSFAVLHNMFSNCFLSQKAASFPSYEYDGTFSQLAQKIWVQQHNDLMKVLGREYFYNDLNPMLRRSYGAIYMKEMTYPEFVREIEPLYKLLHAKEDLKEI
ncbi:MAG: glucosamine-6-phosphate deaminase, partial [bacterium]